ncbi:MAG: pantetheine-phosphate adenylyltransferase [Erysipelotrichaceae bacterium]|nr:pantetheine-phosphate adenylyltransferase [Erysipelotrichaceae bacterium]
MVKAIYPGSFDPITEGHLDIIKRAAKTFDVLYVAIMVNPEKHYTFDQKERAELIKKCCKNLKNVKVVVGEGLTVNFAKKMGCNVIVRGIRAVTDYESELALATSNMTLNDKIETIFFVSRPELSFLSSSIAKEIASFGGDIDKFIPKAIQQDVKKKLKK